MSEQWAAAAGRLAVPLIALAVAALGVLNLWSALLAHGPGRAELLRDDLHLPLIVEHGSRTLIALFGLGLLMVARSLARQKRQAWRIASLMLAVAPFLHLAKGLDWEEAVICLLLLGILFQYRHMFWAENDQPSARQGVISAAGLFLFAALYGPIGMLLLRREFRPHPTLSLAVRASVALLTFSNPSSFLGTRTHRAAWFEDSLLIISSFALSYGLVMLLRPVFPREAAEEQQRMNARRLLECWGSSPLGYFTLLGDKHYVFEIESGGAWGVAYRVIGQHAVALGDPLGDPERAEEAIDAFLRLCKGHDWKPSFYQVTGQNLYLYRRMGMKSLKIGQDSVIDLTAFSMKGKQFQDLRTALNKMAKMDIIAEECLHGSNLDSGSLAQMEAISSEWLLARHGTEKGFAMGSFSPQSELFHDSRIFFARQKSNGQVLGFLTFVPIYGKGETEPVIDGWNLDLMRRPVDAINGVMEFLITTAAVRFQAEGAKRMSLGLSPLSGADSDDEPESLEIFERARGILFHRFNFFYSFDGLYGFKKKFAPQWDSRYLIYHSHADLFATIYAILEAHSPRRIASMLKQILHRN